MLAFLLEIMTETTDFTRWTEHGAFGRELIAGSAVLPVTDDKARPAGHTILDLSDDFPGGPDIEPDVSETSVSESISAYQLFGSLSEFVSCELDVSGALEECELEPGLQVVRVSKGAFGQMVSTRFAGASLLVHALMILLVIVAAARHPHGTYGQGGEKIMVRFVAQEECVPLEETPASVDSAASSPSVAGTPERDKNKRQDDKPEKQEEVPQQQSDAPRVVASNEPSAVTAREEEAKKQVDRKVNDMKSGDGPIDSIASLPSVASEERRMLSAGGSDMESFQSRVLAAIREAIYFPKEALARRKHGETVVQFSVNRDGSVSGLSVTQPSGSSILDEAALVIIQKASKNFPSNPERLAKESVSYVVPIHFKEKRSRAASN
jgi:periplasmic protein TonB